MRGVRPREAAAAVLLASLPIGLLAFGEWLVEVIGGWALPVLAALAVATGAWSVRSWMEP